MTELARLREVDWGRAHRALRALPLAGHVLSYQERRDLVRAGRRARHHARSADTLECLTHWQAVWAYAQRAELYARLRRGDLLKRDILRLAPMGAVEQAAALDFGSAGGGSGGSGFGDNMLFQWNETDLDQFLTGDAVVTAGGGAVTWSYEAISATELSARIRALCTWVSVDVNEGCYLPIAQRGAGAPAVPDGLADIVYPSDTRGRCVAFCRMARNDGVAGVSEPVFTWQGLMRSNETYTTAGLFGSFGLIYPSTASAGFGYAEGSVAPLPPFVMNAVTPGFFAVLHGDYGVGAVTPSIGNSYRFVLDSYYAGGGAKPVSRIELSADGGVNSSQGATRAPNDAGSNPIVGTDAAWNDQTLKRLGLMVKRANNCTDVACEFADLVVMKHWLDWT